MIVKHRYLAYFAIATALNTPTSSWADDTALYPTATPADAAFVRTLAKHAISEIDGMPFPSFDDEMCRDYCAVSAAHLPSVAPNTFISFFEDSDGALHSLEEPARGPASKVNLIVINAGEDPVRLVVPERNLGVVEQVEPHASGSRAVNPVSTKLAVISATNSAVLGTFDLSLSRGQDLTFFVQNGQVELIENAYGPVLTLH
jgi:hypothetical protein